MLKQLKYYLLIYLCFSRQHIQHWMVKGGKDRKMPGKKKCARKQILEANFFFKIQSTWLWKVFIIRGY